MPLLGLNTGRRDYGQRMLGSGDGDNNVRMWGTDLFLGISSLCLDMGHLLLRVSKLSLGMHMLYLDVRKLLGLSRGGEGGSGSGLGSRAVKVVEWTLAMGKLLLCVSKLSLELHSTVRAIGGLAWDVRSQGWVSSGSQQVGWRRGLQGRGGAWDWKIRSNQGFYSYFLKSVEPSKVARIRNVGNKRLGPTLVVVTAGVSDLSSNHGLIFNHTLVSWSPLIT